MRAGIGLGSNLGDRLQSLLLAIEAIRSISCDPTRDRVSSIYETSPVGCAPGTPGFLNAAMEIEIHESPHELLARLQDLEEKSGRPVQREKNSPRSLDLDVLYVDDLILQTPALVLPHPLIHERQFVLAPLSEISPSRVLSGKTLSIIQAFELVGFDNGNYVNLFKRMN